MSNAHITYLTWFLCISAVVWLFVATFKGCHTEEMRLKYRFEAEKIKAKKGVVDTHFNIIEE